MELETTKVEYGRGFQNRNWGEKNKEFLTVLLSYNEHKAIKSNGKGEARDQFHGQLGKPQFS